MKVKLSDLYDIGSSKRVFQSEWRESGVPFYRAREIAKLSADGFVDNELFIDEELYAEYIEKYGKPEAGDVMVTGVGTLGVCYVVKSEDRFYFKDGNILWFRQKAKDRILPEYLVKAFDSKEVKDFIDKNSSGTTVGTFTIQTAKKMEISLPSLIEQKEIIDKVTRIESIIKQRKQEIRLLDDLIKARFVELFGDPRNNPFGFTKQMLKDTCKVVTGNTPSRSVDDYYGDYVEWIKTDNIVSGLLNPTRAVECLSEEGMKVGRTVEKDSILMACIAGSIASIGRVCVTDRTVAFNQQINAVVPEEYNILFLYVLLQLSKDYLVEEINMALKGILSKSKLEEKEFIVPPMELQEQFADFVKQVDKSKFIKKIREEIQMKYVAFLDILGFKDRLKRMSQIEAREYIASFSSLVYTEFSMSKRNLVNGYIVSDSIILYTNSCAENELIELVKLVDAICKKEFVEKGILIRGAISKGDFDRLPAEELPHLQKELIVGQAYVDAYLMEGTVKTLGIVLAEEVCSDLRNCNMGQNIVEEQSENTTQYVYRYLSVDFFMDEKNLKEYVRLAVESSWLPHYYNTLYFTMKNEDNDKKVDSIFINIVKILQNNYDWRTLDLFIKNSFGEKVFSRYQTRFLRYLRQNTLKGETM